MLVIKIEGGKDTLEKALKKYKRKFEKTGVMKELRKRKEFVKKSVKRRLEIKKAEYIQKKFGGND